MDAKDAQPEDGVPVTDDAAGVAVAERDGRPEVAERAESAAAEKIAEADHVLQDELDELFSTLGGDDDTPDDPTDALVKHLTVEAEADPPIDEELTGGDALDELLDELQPEPTAESEREPIPAEPTPQPEPSPTADAKPETAGLSGELDALFDELNGHVEPDDEKPEPAEEPPAPEPVSTKDDIDGELDELFDSIVKGQVPKDPEPRPVFDDPPPAEEPDSPDAEALRAEMALDETPVDSDDAAEEGIDTAKDESPDTTPAAASTIATDADQADPQPWWVNLLITLNRPLDGLSDTARDAIGKIGIVTLANALALIVYVLVMR